LHELHETRPGRRAQKSLYGETEISAFFLKSADGRGVEMSIKSQSCAEIKDSYDSQLFLP